MSGPPANRLAAETSPYLLQHAHNPVDWRPWGKEAIEEARRQGKPLFVSIGYATCYWCHVMERESFEDEATAEVLNRLFVPVKVDREQRPDIDEVYMTACQVFTRATEGRASGGWPLSVFVEPTSLKPFFVGTYYPPEPAFGRPSFTQVLESLASAWRDLRPEVLAQADRLAVAIEAEFEHAPPVASLDGEVTRSAVQALLRFHDSSNGGFGGAPKFPQPAYLELLASRWDDPAVAKVLGRTLDAMACGGIFDHLAGGFHRYSVDAEWRVPHFEKMLYDNAQLLSLYARSSARTGDRFHAEVARRTAEYLLARLRAPDGAFLSAQDAEVDAREGLSYVWVSEEVTAALAAAGRGDLASFALRLYGLDQGTNFQDPHHPSEPQRNVLFLGDRPERLAAAMGLERGEFDSKRSTVNAILLASRDRRQQPLTDDKVLAAWNGLAIAALAEAGSLLHERSLVDAAEQAMEAIEVRLHSVPGRWMRSSRAGAATVGGFLEDYAFLCKARIALYRATSKAEHLVEAEQLFAEVKRLFGAGERGSFDTALAREGEEDVGLFLRVRNLTDGAVPSGNGVLLLDTLDLLAVTGKASYRDDLRRTLAGLSGAIQESPVERALSCVAIQRAEGEAPDTLPRPSAHHDSGERVRAGARASASPDGTVVGELELSISPGWHINAHDPGDEHLVGLSITLASPAGSPSLEVDYPPGEPWRDGVRVHSGLVRIPFRVRGVEVGSPLQIVVGVQPCDERTCERPRELRVEVRIPAR